MTTTKTRAYQEALQSVGVPENLARTERGQRVINKLHNSAE